MAQNTMYLCCTKMYKKIIKENIYKGFTYRHTAFILHTPGYAYKITHIHANKHTNWRIDK